MSVACTGNKELVILTEPFLPALASGITLAITEDEFNSASRFLVLGYAMKQLRQ
jgi:hypothetical protein